MYAALSGRRMTKGQCKSLFLNNTDRQTPLIFSHFPLLQITILNVVTFLNTEGRGEL